MTDERRLVSREDFDYHKANGEVIEGGLFDGGIYDFEQWFAALPQPATEPALDGPYAAIQIEDAKDDWWAVTKDGENIAFTGGEDARLIVDALNARLAAQPSAEVERLRAAAKRLSDRASVIHDPLRPTKPRWLVDDDELSRLRAALAESHR